ncbi:MAG: hypothetical protein OEY59_13320, partial [Deltaproteobacteria bacterium]|nr:hypothetical protein [Deltaproteobacteria bacterium]
MLDPETCLKDFLDDLFAEYKAKRIEYCLLRNYESLPERLDSADIDILISSSARKKNREIIKNISVNHNALICSLYVDERFDQITLFRRISSKHIFSVKLDFYSLQLYGVRLLSESDGLASRIAYRNFYVASDTWQVLDKWLFGYLLNAPLPEKYHEKFQEVFSNNYHAMAISLSGIFGEKRALQICETVCKAGFSCLPKVGKLELLCILS